MRLLAHERVAGGGEHLRDERLDPTVNLRDDVVAVALGVNPQALARVQCQARPRTHRLKPLSQQLVHDRFLSRR